MSSEGPQESITNHAASTVAESAASKKSYRRKYRKIMVTFEEGTRESNNLFREEQRISEISQRLAEQTDQLLQLLLELNSLPQVPPRLRYDLTPPGYSSKAIQSPAAKVDEEEGHLRLQKARMQLQSHEITPAEYHAIEDSLLDTEDLKPSRSYASLLQHAPRPAIHDEIADTAQEHYIGFISAKDEEQYLQSLDNFLDEKGTHPRAHVANHQSSRGVDRTIQMEREMQLKNPVSVYNWLRRHQPQVFLQDNEPASEKPARATASRSSARKATSSEQWKREGDKFEELYPAYTAPPTKGKRKRDNDGGYRPKGGNARGTKRKKEGKEESTRGKRAKKVSTG